MKTAAVCVGTAMALLAAGCGKRSGPNIDAAVAAHTPVCQHTCTPDLYPPLVDCATAEAPFEFYPIEIGKYEDEFALRTYSYTDQSNPIASFHDMGKTWEPYTTAMTRCYSPENPSNRVLHVQGGPFLAWGGGVGQSMKDFADWHTPKVQCSTSSDPVCQGRDPIVPTIDPTNGMEIHPTLNFSDWEGVSFWARRGPDSQNGLRVLAGDRFTDDDVNYLMTSTDPTIPHYCERIRECACQNHMACDPFVVSPESDCFNGQMGQQVPGTSTVVPSTYCGPPKPLPSAAAGNGSIPCNSCDRNRCDEEWPAYPGSSDPAFVGRPCLPFTYRNGVSSSYCFNPALGEKPAEPDQQCGDHWTKTVALTNEWQFFTVPFSSMTQQGWAKHETQLDLKNLTLIRFTWDGGWADFYIDDVRFYRHKQ